MGQGASRGTHPELGQERSPQVHPNSGFTKGRTAENRLLFTFGEVLHESTKHPD